MGHRAVPGSFGIDGEGGVGPDNSFLAHLCHQLRRFAVEVFQGTCATPYTKYVDLTCPHLAASLLTAVLRLLQSYHKAALVATREFWRLLLRNSVNLNSLTRAFRKIEQMERLADKTYKVVLERYPKVRPAVRCSTPYRILDAQCPRCSAILYAQLSGFTRTHIRLPVVWPACGSSYCAGLTHTVQHAQNAHVPSLFPRPGRQVAALLRQLPGDGQERPVDSGTVLQVGALGGALDRPETATTMGILTPSVCPSGYPVWAP